MTVTQIVRILWGQGRCWLVEEEDFRLHRQRTGQRGAACGYGAGGGASDQSTVARAVSEADAKHTAGGVQRLQ